MGSKVNQPASTQPHAKDNFQNVSKQLKCSDILKLAVTTFTSNFKFMYLMILSILPLCFFMIFYEIKLQKMTELMPRFLDYTPLNSVLPISNSYQQDNDANKSESRFFSDFLQLCVFYSVVYPLLEVFSVFITIKLAAVLHPSQPRVVEKEVIDHNNIEGTLITYLCVHLLSALTFLVLFWVVVTQILFLIRFMYSYGYYSIEAYLNHVSIGLHSGILIVLLYKYLNRSALWNMAMVISVLEEETGIAAFGLSDCYGKQCKQTGLRLMLIFFTFCNGLRLLALFFGFSNPSFAGVCVTAIVIGLFCLGNLVKWVAFVLYFYHCKQQVMEKKGDAEVSESLKKVADDAC